MAVCTGCIYGSLYRVHLWLFSSQSVQVVFVVVFVAVCTGCLWQSVQGVFVVVFVAVCMGCICGCSGGRLYGVYLW